MDPLQQLICLKRAIAEKRPEYVTRHEAIIFHHDNARSHVAIPVKNYLENSGWEVLPHLPYSPDFFKCTWMRVLGTLSQRVSEMDNVGCMRT